MPPINSGSGYAGRKSFLGSQLLVVLINAVIRVCLRIFFRVLIGVFIRVIARRICCHALLH